HVSPFHKQACYPYLMKRECHPEANQPKQCYFFHCRRIFMAGSKLALFPTLNKPSFPRPWREREQLLATLGAWSLPPRRRGDAGEGDASQPCKKYPDFAKSAFFQKQFRQPKRYGRKHFSEKLTANLKNEN